MLKLQRTVMLAAASLSMLSCRSVNVAWRGTVYATENVASTEGKVQHHPEGGFSSSVDAPKTTQDSLKANIPSSGEEAK